MNYPISFRFKLAALASQISAKDASGTEFLYVKQKMFKLKEKIEIYRDSSKSQLMYTLNADRVIDFSPVLTLSNGQGVALGSIKRRGRVSLWQATYEISFGDQLYATVKEANPWAKVLDTFLAEVPVLGWFTGYFFHPRYTITATNGAQLGELEKQASFFEHNYTLKGEGLTSLNEEAQQLIIVMVMAVTLRERMRG